MRYTFRGIGNGRGSKNIKIFGVGIKQKSQALFEPSSGKSVSQGVFKVGILVL